MTAAIKPLDPLPSPPSPSETEQEVDRMLADQAKQAAMLRQQYYTSPASALPAITAGTGTFFDSGVVLQLMKQTELINSLVARVNQIERPVPQSIAEAAEEKAAIDPFACLNIPFLTGEKPQKPQYEVYFEMGKLGTMAARYHAVVPGNQCLALIYDTRFEDGVQYLPPNLGEQEFQVTVTKPKPGKFVCLSFGVHWSLGCLDVAILVQSLQEGVA